MPKELAALLSEGKSHLLRLLQEIPLGEAEQAAVEDGLTAYEKLLSRLVDVQTPAGPTPRQIGADLVQITSLRPTVQPFLTMRVHVPNATLEQAFSTWHPLTVAVAA